MLIAEQKLDGFGAAEEPKLLLLLRDYLRGWRFVWRVGAARVSWLLGSSLDLEEVIRAITLVAIVAAAALILALGNTLSVGRIRAHAARFTLCPPSFGTRL